VMTIAFYLDQYKKAWITLKRNPILLVPDIIFFAAFLIFGYLALTMSGVFPLFEELSKVAEMIDSTEQAEHMVKNILTPFIKENTARLFSAFLFFIISTFVVGTTAAGAKYGMIKTVLANKTPTVRAAWKISKTYFWKIIGVKILTFLLFTGAIFIAAILMATVGGIHAAINIILFILLIFVLVAVFLGIYVRFPILFKKDLSPKQTIINSLKFFKTHKLFVITIVLIIYATFVIVELITKGLSALGVQFTPIIASFVVIVILLITHMFTTIYLFQTFEYYKKR
jgi:hypothetical protein